MSARSVRGDVERERERGGKVNGVEWRSGGRCQSLNRSGESRRGFKVRGPRREFSWRGKGEAMDGWRGYGVVLAGWLLLLLVVM